MFLISMGAIAQCPDGNIAPHIKSFSNPEESIKVIGVIDGDTLKAVIPSLPDPLRNVSIRILGIDTPEMRSRCPKEKVLARVAKTFIETELKTVQKITLKDLSWDKYGGRILAQVFFDKRDIGQLLIDAKLATPYHGEKKLFDWCAFSQSY